MVEYGVQREGSHRACWVGKETAEVGFPGGLLQTQQEEQSVNSWGQLGELEAGCRAAW